MGQLLLARISTVRATNTARQRRQAAPPRPTSKRSNQRKPGAQREPAVSPKATASRSRSRSRGLQELAKGLADRLREKLSRKRGAEARARVGNRRREAESELPEGPSAAFGSGGSLRELPGGEREWPRRFARVTLRMGMVLGVAWALLFAGREVYEYATTSARFEVQHFVYEPTAHVDDDELRRLLDLEPGRNILSLELDELSRRIAAHPWVAKATVTRNLPDTLAIEVVEHVPAAVVLAERFYLVDGEGVPFKQLERGERGELPIITGIERELLADESRRDQAIAQIRRGLDVLSLYQAKQRPRLAEVHLANDGAVVLYTAESGTQLQLGRDDFDARLARWDALRAALGERADRLAVVHLDHESRPDRRDRVVARFASEHDDAVLLADAAEQQADDYEAGSARELEASGAEQARTQSARKPAAAAGKRNRIPRYE